MRIAIAACCLAVFVAAGCARTSPARFYTLQPAAEKREGAPAKSFVLAVGPMSVATHLDRPQIATRVGSHELRFDPYHRWAEPLKDSVPTVLAENLRAVLPDARIVQYPGSETMAYDVRVVVQVVRFDAEMGGDATLRAGWALIKPGKDVQEAGAMFEQSLPVKGDDYAALVEAESRLLALLAKEIAESVRSLRTEARE